MCYLASPNQLDLKIITDELKFAHNIELLSTKEIKTKYFSYDDAVYMIEFNRDQVSKKEIQKIRFFYNIAVKWKTPYKGNKGPTQ